MSTLLEKKEYRATGFKNLRENIMVELELKKTLSEAKGPVGEMCRHILSAGGKRIRPLLVIYSGLMRGSMSKDLIKAAEAAELIHMASLVHDDIIDEAGLRRGRPSLNSIYGKHSAVLCGDYLFARAFGILAENRLIKSMDQMVRAIENMCSAELVQAATLFKLNQTIDDYYKRIAGKTAIFFECCCKSGAYVAGAPDGERELLGEYGLHLGFAFQIMDDVLDFSGDEKMLGKPVCGDLTAGIISLPVLYLLESASHGNWAGELISRGEISAESAGEITEVLKREKFLDRARDTAAMHAERAVACLSGFPDCEFKRVLELLAVSVVSPNN